MILLSMKDNACAKVIEGSIPVLLSAPHAYSHKRPSLTMSYKWGENLTDRMVEEICTRTGAWGIVQDRETSFDPNWHKVKSNSYKQLVGDIIEKNKINKFVDIHGLRDEYEYDLGIYYPSKFFKSILLANDIANSVDMGKLKDMSICIFRFPDDLQETLGEYVATKLRVPAVQLEVARYIREDEHLRKVFVQNISSFLVI